MTEFIPPDGALLELVRCLEPGGILILGTLNQRSNDNLTERLASFGLAVLDHARIRGGEVILKAQKRVCRYRAPTRRFKPSDHAPPRKSKLIFF